MRNLKRIGAAGGALALIACWPLAVGQIGERLLTDSVSNFDVQDISIKLTSYDRGYLSAKATTHIEVIGAELKAALMEDGIPTEYVLHHDIKHKLLGLEAKTVLQDIELFNATLTTDTSLSGDTQFSLDLSDFSFQQHASTKGSFTVKQSTLKGDIALNGDMAFKFDIPSVQFESTKSASVELSGITGEVKGNKQGNLWYGQESISIDQFSIIDPSLSRATIDNIRYQFESKTNPKSQRYDTSHYVKIGKGDFSGYAWDQLSFNLLIGGFDSGLLNQFITDIHQPVLADSKTVPSLDLLNKLLSQGLFIALEDMQLSVNSATTDANWRIELPSGFDNVIQGNGDAFDALNGNIYNYLSKAITQEFNLSERDLDELVALGYLSNAQDGYKLEANIANGNIVFASGEKIPLIPFILSGMMWL